MPVISDPPVARRDPAALSRLLMTALALVLLWPGLVVTEFDLPALFDSRNLSTIGAFLNGFWPPEVSHDFLGLLWVATLQTLAMATAGLALALIAAVPLSLIATRALSISGVIGRQHGWMGRSIRYAARLLMIVLRSVPELVWALLFVRAVGLGPTAGVLAIAITYSGMLGKVYAEIYESVDQRPAQALLHVGSSRLAAFFYGLLPSAAQELTSYTLYRWECAIRASVVMGFVGAGGLGQMIDLSIRMFAGGEVATILATFLILVLFADQLSSLLRQRLA
ncbi:phosphonate transport system permease protein [Halopseudomonas xinjiangensis]|uniref:Phosphonate transport system permease protein n=1 Tax=Halopseudomonas xinjiangensis TaxID=487184 RepID=A0A1H1MLX4_9GAMM|nr:ABC transporter permease [Halopseudomonas xinjiangensis]SDR87804.1 phosphonate transport system permease protein [Halopseudomonas xinjiangensis]